MTTEHPDDFAAARERIADGLQRVSDYIDEFRFILAHPAFPGKREAFQFVWKRLVDQAEEVRALIFDVWERMRPDSPRRDARQRECDTALLCRWWAAARHAGSGGGLDSTAEETHLRLLPLRGREAEDIAVPRSERDGAFGQMPPDRFATLYREWLGSVFEEMTDELDAA